MSVVRGIRGATTVSSNTEKEMMEETKKLVLEMVKQNHVDPTDISHVFFSATNDLNAIFPAKVAREMPGWTYVPVMCMQEMNVPNSLPKCIRIMMVVNTSLQQDEVKHVFLNDAVVLRPDLVQKEGD